MRTTQVTANAVVVSYWTSTSRKGWGGLINNTAGKITFQGLSTTATALISLVSTTSINDGNPHHVAFNYNRASGGANQLYIDGIQEASGNSSNVWTDSSTGFFIEAGDQLDAFWPTYVGDLWELAHYKGSQLTADEIVALAKGHSPKLVSPANLAFYAPLVRDTHDVRGGFAVNAISGTTVIPNGRELGGAV
jgi:hypothetical protein